MFDKLHDLEAKALNLHYDCSHPAFVEHYEYIAHVARTAIRLFRTKRASFIANSSALEDARRELEAAAENVRDVLVRYRFMEKLVKERRGGPQIGEKFEERVADQKWTHGVISADPLETRRSKVLLTDGTLASHAKIEVTTRRSVLRFECRGPLSEGVGENLDENQSTLILSHPPCYIVGWTLSCRSGSKSGSKTFCVESGGILASHLSIDIAATTSIFRRASVWPPLWRCRIYFVDKRDYNFPQLTGCIDEEL